MEIMMNIRYELNSLIQGEILKVESLKNDKDDLIYEVKTFHGLERQVSFIEVDNVMIYFNGIINLDTGEYLKDPDNLNPIEINGRLYELDENGEVFIKNREPIPEISQYEQAQLSSDLKIDMIVAGLINENWETSIKKTKKKQQDVSEGYNMFSSSPIKMWRDRYVRNAVTIESLQKLVTHGFITQSTLAEWVKERLEGYGI